MQAPLHSLNDICSDLNLLGRLVSTVGVVVEYRGNTRTRNGEWKSMLRLRDNNGQELEFHLFHRDEKAMPQKSYIGCGAIIISAKVQRRDGQSLLSSSSTEITYYDPLDINSLSPKTTPVFYLNKSSKRGVKPTQATLDILISVFNETTKPDSAEDGETVVISKISSASNKKFSLIKDIAPENWYNILVQLVHEPIQVGNKMHLWVTDYSSNSMLAYSNGTFGDELNYLGDMNDDNAAPPCRTTQLPAEMLLKVTLYGAHMDEFLSLEPKVSQWFHLQNVKIGFHGAYTPQGAIHETANFTHDVRVKKVVVETEFSDKESHLYAAARRRNNFLRNKSQSTPKESSTQQSPPAQLNEAKDNNKPSAPPPSKQKRNGRDRRKAKEAKIKAQEELDIQRKLPEDMTLQVVCETHTSYISSVAEMLRIVSYDAKVDGELVKIDCPFNLAKYLAVVRIVDFQPPDIRDFTQSRLVYKDGQPLLLSDDEESESEIDFNPTLMSESWEWGFSLKLQDAMVSAQTGTPPFVWVNVNNDSAQYLLDMEAVNLRENDDALAKLKHKMFHLWDRLEEVKRAEEANKKGLLNKAKGAQRNDEMPHHSSDGEQSSSVSRKSGSAKPTRCALKPKAFKCCIQQYGVVLPTRNPRDANVDDRNKYTRQYMLFGTRLRDD
ncbi:hypothetical protein Cpir12675_005945 [Ceratocystis pirilliformis]|uniref:Protection of telomeres protein 1 ssDNA-binding domain-containing protein n=1 Tax=Ceratocystis pirilliformis TaxID=259994 RepID=A0ABR3YMG3_9PEZI